MYNKTKGPSCKDLSLNCCCKQSHTRAGSSKLGENKARTPMTSRILLYPLSKTKLQPMHNLEQLIDPIWVDENILVVKEMRKWWALGSPRKWSQH